MAKINARQQKFIEEYLIDLNGTQAAIRAGYSPRSAQRMLSDANIKNEIAAAAAERSRRTGITQDEVLRELAKIAFLNPADLIDLDTAAVRDEAKPDDTAAILSVKVKTSASGEITERDVKTYDKMKALELLGKHLGMFTERAETGKAESSWFKE